MWPRCDGFFGSPPERLRADRSPLADSGVASVQAPDEKGGGATTAIDAVASGGAPHGSGFDSDTGCTHRTVGSAEWVGGEYKTSRARSISLINGGGPRWMGVLSFGVRSLELTPRRRGSHLATSRAPATKK